MYGLVSRRIATDASHIIGIIRNIMYQEPTGMGEFEILLSRRAVPPRGHRTSRFKYKKFAQTSGNDM